MGVCCFQSYYSFLVYLFFQWDWKDSVTFRYVVSVRHNLALNDFMAPPAMVVKFILCWHHPASFR